MIIQNKKIPRYTQKDVLRELQISQSTLYRLRKEFGLLTQVKKRRYTLEEIEEIAELIINKYKTKTDE
ncbi:MAG: hypothetical protein RBR79_02005 [Bacteroidales bacterium]|jgi:predicted site-specific integrase-resolvase|nr:hypothetical protein [Bacteroidales bacterium]